MLAGCGWLSTTEPEAAQAVRTAETVADGITAGKSHVVWDCLTDQQQRDVNGLVHRVAEKLPAEPWDNLFQVIELWGKALKEKREFALNCPTLKQGHAELKQYGNPLAAFLMKLAKSDVRDLEQLKTADVGAILKQLDPELLKAIPALLQSSPELRESGVTRENYEQMMKHLATASFTLDEHDEKSAKVFMPIGEGQVVEFPFIKSTNRWVPEIPEQDWQEFLTEANREIDHLSEKENSPLAIYGPLFNALVTTQLERVLEAKTQAEFDELLADPSYLMLRYFFFANPDKFLTRKN